METDCRSLTRSREVTACFTYNESAHTAARCQLLRPTDNVSQFGSLFTQKKNLRFQRFAVDFNPLQYLLARRPGAFSESANLTKVLCSLLYVVNRFVDCIKISSCVLIQL